MLESLSVLQRSDVLMCIHPFVFARECCMCMYPGTDFGFRLFQPQSAGVLASVLYVCVLECARLVANVHSEEMLRTD